MPRRSSRSEPIWCWSACRPTTSWTACLPPFLAAALGLPYVGVIRGVKAGAEPGTVDGLQGVPRRGHGPDEGQAAGRAGHPGAEQPPRYVPVSRIRAAMKSTQFEEHGRRRRPPRAAACRSAGCIRRPPGSRAEMLAGSEAEVAARIAEILAEKGLVK